MVDRGLLLYLLLISSAFTSAYGSPTASVTTLRLPPNTRLTLVDAKLSTLQRLDTSIHHAIQAEAALGIDLEWRPRTLYADTDAPDHAALLQLALRDEIFVCDLIALADDPLAVSKLRATLVRALSTPRLTKLGFAIAGDLKQLDDVPGLDGASNGALSVRDLQLEACAALGISRRRPIGLSTLSESMLGAPLDKSLQISDWAARPLSYKQFIYAATDAWCLLPIAEALEKLPQPPAVVAEEPAPAPARLEATAAARVERCAPTPTAATPSVSLAAAVEALRSSWVGRRPRAKGARSGSRRAAYMLTASGDATVLHPEIVGSGGGGLTRWANADALFVNVDSKSGRYANTFWTTDDTGILFNWFPGAGTPFRSRTVSRLLSSSSSVLLFCRRDAASPLYYCGELAAQALSATERDPLGKRAPFTNIEHWERRVPETKAEARLGSHVVWRLLDSDVLQRNDGVMRALFGKAHGKGTVEPGSSTYEDGGYELPLLKSAPPVWYDVGRLSNDDSLVDRV